MSFAWIPISLYKYPDNHRYVVELTSENEDNTDFVNFEWTGDRIINRGNYKVDNLELIWSED